MFSLGDHRRSVIGPSGKLPDDYFSAPPRSRATEDLRRRVMDTLDDEIKQFFAERKGQVAVYDANNGTRALRRDLRARWEKLGVHVFFVENICDRPEIIERNIRNVKISSPDFRGWNPDDAVRSYMERIKAHEERYETIDSSSGPFVKIYNAGERLTVHNVRGYLQSRIVFFLMNIHNEYRTIWFARSGQSEIEHSFKADSDLTPAGEKYADALCEFIVNKRRGDRASRLGRGERHQKKELHVRVSLSHSCHEMESR